MSHIVHTPLGALADATTLKGIDWKPDFRIFTAGIESDRQNARLVHMVGSSTAKDLQGDMMSVYALESMTKAADNLTIWLNHDYSLPDSIFGSIIKTPFIVHRDGIADLHFDVDVEMDNPSAAKVKRYIDNGRRLGCSIGCMVTKYEVPDEDDGENWFERSIIIHDVYVVEYSVVGIPANQRSWVENAVRGVFTRTLDPYLAPAMKSMWPAQFKEAMYQAESLREQPNGLKQLQMLLSSPSRSCSDMRLDWYADTKTFSLSVNGLKKQVSREEISDLFAQRAFPNMQNAVRETALDAEYQEDISDIDEVKGVSGKTSWPLNTDAAWDKAAAHPRLLTWAGGKENFSASKFKQVHFWYDNDGSKISDFSYPFCDVTDGKVEAIFKAIEAGAAALGGARSGESAAASKAVAIHKKMAPYYRKAGKNPPWDSDGDGDDNSSPSTDTDHDGKSVQEATMTQKFAVNKDGSQGILLKADGSHDMYKGVHKHHHDAYGHGDNDDHNHDHFHNDDNEHMHDHRHIGTGENGERDKGEYQTEPEKIAQYAINKDGSQGILLKADGGHESYKGVHTHHHEAFGHGDVDAHSHEHYHNDDSAHDHDHARVGMGEHGDSYHSVSPEILASYNMLGKTLGLPEVSLAMAQARSHPAMKAVDVETLKHAKKMHDLLQTMTDGAVCQSTTVPDAEQQAAEQEGNPVDVTVMNSLAEKMGLMAKSLDGLQALTLQKDVTKTREDIAAAQQELGVLQAEILKAGETLTSIKNMPLGNPIHQARSVSPQDAIVSRGELLGVDEMLATQESLALAFQRTEIEREQYANGQSMQYRRWPEGIGGSVAKGVRPPLTANQIQFMSFDDMKAYRDGGAARVPLLDNQVPNGHK